ncbi:WD repeat-containing protein 12 [Cichlidogyrus casuarinus]|uniref:Protein KTI12 homolog n=1 Tax=Cichlidogyrus casuarinus TaxID=1844966 RepID=A0ABD2Q0I2_9PLAT
MLATSEGTATLVIADATNYIKSFRYELFCSAKSLKQLHSVLFLDVPRSTSEEFNAQTKRYPEQVHAELCDRFEAPNPANRWDQPLFRFRLEDSFDDLPDEAAAMNPCEESLVFTEVESLAHAVVNTLVETRRQALPNKSTQAAVAKSADFLLDLDQIVNLVADHVMTSQTMGASFCRLPASLLNPGTESPSLKLLPRFTPHSISRAKQSFLRLVKVNPPAERSRLALAAMFFRFLMHSPQ